jgi:ABC-type multidrug transport system fused ATPase/permease subunit
VFSILDTPVDADRQGSRTPSGRTGRLAVANAGFAYDDGTEALADVSVTAQTGEMVAIVGATGAGKTPLAHMIAGFVEPASGTVTFDDDDIADLDLAALRSRVSFVSQEPAVFDDTAANNIAMGLAGATRDEIEGAARAARADGFIRDLEFGYDSRLGRSGNTLSVGQKQRLAIARGLVSKAPILILDEPTAALDPETEAALVASLDASRAERILIVIAHRLSTIRTADKIVFLRDGRVIEVGSHDELMGIEGGAYREFVDLQTSQGQ